MENCIILIDEENGYTHTNDFANLIKHSSNYFILITREDIPNLPYSIKAVYDLSTIKVSNQYYVTNSERYVSNGVGNKNINCIITEDSKSGRQFINEVSNISVLNLKDNGNSNLSHNCKKVLDSGKKPLVIADGAALGAFAEELYKYASDNDIYLWAPESFEYLLLSRIVWRKDVDIILENPSEQISSELFISWERFFTWLVIDIMSKYHGREYSKSVLKSWYYADENKKKFLTIVPDEIKQYFM